MNQSFTSFKEFRERYPIRPNDTGALLGSGSYGRVFKVEDQLETEWVAVKISEFKGDDPKSLKAEVELAQRVPRQTNIARYDACYRLETDTSVSDFAIMKYYPDGNLVDLLRHQTLTPDQLNDITRGILLGLKHLHKHRIVHRDFKPANILISRDNAGRFIPKIADFGLSKLVHADELDSSDFDLSDGRGTPSYKAPEQIEGSRVSFNLDLWAFGVILYEMLTGEKPFRSDGRNASEQSARRDIEKKIMSVDLPTRLNQVAEPYQAMIRRCLVRDIRGRVRREDELLDLLDDIPSLLAEAAQKAAAGQYEQAIQRYEQVLGKRDHHAEAEKELVRCQGMLHEQRIGELLRKADAYVARQEYEAAKASYAQVLQLTPTHPIAARGLADCLEQLRPKPLAQPEPLEERTDAYEDRTDVYQPPAPVIGKEKSVDSAAPTTASTNRPPVKPASAPAGSRPKATVVRPPGVDKPMPTQAVVAAPKRVVPWKLLVPVAAGLVGVVLYVGFSPPPDTGATRDSSRTSPMVSALRNGSEPREPDTKRPAGATGEPSPSMPGPTLSGNNADKAAITQRVDVALGKARQAYSQKNYTRTLELTGSALQLDPTRADVAQLQRKAQADLQSPNGTTSTTPTTQDVAVVSPIPLKVEPEPPTKKVEEEKTDVKKTEEPSVNNRQKLQDEYDELIEDGMMAIANGNNKAKAIADFGRARSLAKEHDLQTARADAAYSLYMTKANKIFASEEYDGAKGWYTVAQSLKDTPEVRVKIKQCSNQ